MKKSFILLLLLSVFSISSYAKIIYVDSTHVGGVQNGFSWTTAFSNFQTAIDSAHSGDSLFVAKGTYKPVLSGSSFAMKDSVKIFGGFLNTHTSFQSRDWARNATVLRGNADIVIVNSMFNIVGPEAWLDGFTITGGVGGGMENSFSSPTVNNCTFIANTNTSGAAAMQNTGSISMITNCKFINNQGGVAVTNAGFGAFPPDSEPGPSFFNCVFSGNTGNDGGAVTNGGCIVNFTNCNFTNNTTTDMGGAMNNIEAVIKITNCTFTNNNATVAGGAIYQHECISEIASCTFTGNKAQYGGGVASWSDTSIRPMTIANCSFTDNKAIIAGISSKDQLYGGGVYNVGKANVSNCVFRNNTAGHNNSGAAGGGLYSNSRSMNATSTINNCRFYNNKTYVGAITWWASNAIGGGAYIADGNITDCIFEENESTISGGGLFISGITPKDGQVTRCQFIGNRAEDGGGIFASAGLRLYNCLLVKNRADSTGGAIHLSVYQNYDVHLANNTITRNTSLLGGGIYAYAYGTGASPYKLSNNIIWGNNSGIAKLASVPAPVITYSLIQGLAADPTNHILNGASDPLFVDTAGGNYHLMVTSPCIDMGRNDSLPTVFNKDLANQNRIYNTTIDLGAYEYGIFQPQVSFGNDTAVCSNTSLLLQAPYLAATTYSWSTGANTSSIKVTTPGKYYVTLSNNVGTASDTIIVTHNMAPVVNLGNDTTYCGSGRIALDARNPGASYLWSINATSQIIHVGTGTYSVLVTDSNMCRAADTVKVTQLSLSVNLGNDIAVTQGANVTLDAGNPGATYLWSTGATTQTIVVNTTGTYSVTVTNSQGCSVTDEINVTVFPVGIDDVNADNKAVSIHPNPARDQVQIRISDLNLLNTKLMLYDAYGRVVRTVVLQQHEQPLSLEGLAPAVYFIKLEDGKTIRLIKQ